MGKSMKANRKEKFTLPLSAKVIYKFCYWEGWEEGKKNKQDVTAKTLEKYLYGIKAWNLYHTTEYPAILDARVKVILRESVKEDANVPPKEKKASVRLNHFVFLIEKLWEGSTEEEGVLGLALVAFLSMA